MDERTGTGIRHGSDSSDRSSSDASVSDGFDRVISGREPLAHITNTVGHSSQASNNGTQTTECAGAIIPEWDGCFPDLIIKAMKALDKEDLQCLGKREFYKSYGSWEKLLLDQHNKMISYFRLLSEDIQSTCFLVAIMCLVV
jgi:hypothetical protein